MCRVMTKKDIEEARPPSWQKSVWGAKQESRKMEMWKKTVIKRLLKYAPLSQEIGRAVTLDQHTERGATLEADLETMDLQVVEPDPEPPEQEPYGNDPPANRKIDDVAGEAADMFGEEK